MLSIGRRNRAAVLEVCFHLKVETGFVTSPKMFNLQARRTCQIAIVRCHCSKGLATECLPKRQSRRHRLVWGLLCELTCVLPSVFIGHMPMTSLPERIDCNIGLT